MENTTNTTATLDELTLFVLDSLSTKDEDNKVVGFDLAKLDVIIKELQNTKKQLKTEQKATEKANKEAEKEEQAELGKTYYNSLKVGDEFSYRMADGTVKTLRKIETKSKSNATAAGALVIPEGKTPNRYPKFHQVIIPAVETDELDEDNQETA